MEKSYYRNYMWKVYPGSDYYRFQTEDPKVAEKIRRVKGKEKSVNELLKENGHAYEYYGGKKRLLNEEKNIH